jgi:hypothetical protein
MFSKIYLLYPVIEELINYGRLLSTNPRTLEEASRTFDKVAKASDDRTAIKILGLTWDNKVLNTLYKTVKSELDVLQHILEESSKAWRKAGRKMEEPENENDETKPKQKSLTEWIK